MRQGKGLSSASRKRTKACTRAAGQPEAVCGATTQNCCASAGSAPEWSKAVKSATLEATSSTSRGSGGCPVAEPRPGSTELPRAARRALMRHRSRAGALPRLHIDHAGTRPKCSSTGGVPVAPSEIMSQSRLPDSPAPCRYSSKGSGAAAAAAASVAAPAAPADAAAPAPGAQARCGVCTRAAKVAGSRISVRGELVEEAKHRLADREAASAIWGLEDRVDLLQTCARPSRALLAPRPWMQATGQ